MKRLIRYSASFGSMGELSGIFLLLNDEEWFGLERLIEDETEVWFGEVFGRHSDIYGAVEEGEISIVTEDQEWLDLTVSLEIDLDSGINPLQSQRCESCDGHRYWTRDGDICKCSTTETSEED